MICFEDMACQAWRGPCLAERQLLSAADPLLMHEIPCVRLPVTKRGWLWSAENHLMANQSPCSELDAQNIGWLVQGHLGHLSRVDTTIDSPWGPAWI